MVVQKHRRLLWISWIQGKILELMKSPEFTNFTQELPKCLIWIQSSNFLVLKNLKIPDSASFHQSIRNQTFFGIQTNKIPQISIKPHIHEIKITSEMNLHASY